MKEKILSFFEKCREKTQEERKKIQTVSAVICGLILIGTVLLSLNKERGILSYLYLAVFLLILVLSNIFQKNTGWNMTYFKKIMLVILVIAFAIIIAYGFISGQAFTN